MTRVDLVWMLQMDEIDLRDSTVLVSRREMSNIEKRNKTYKSAHEISCYQAKTCIADPVASSRPSYRMFLAVCNNPVNIFVKKI